MLSPYTFSLLFWQAYLLLFLGKLEVEANVSFAVDGVLSWTTGDKHGTRDSRQEMTRDAQVVCYCPASHVLIHQFLCQSNKHTVIIIPVPTHNYRTRIIIVLLLTMYYREINNRELSILKCFDTALCVSVQVFTSCFLMADSYSGSW